MKKRYFLILCLLLLLFGSTAYASAENGGTDSLALTEENRYDKIYYQKPEKRYPVSGGKARLARENQDFETYIMEALQQFQTRIDVSAYRISRAEAGAAYFQVLNDNPSLFYVEGAVKWSYDSNGMVTSYHSIRYRDTPANIKRQQEELEQAAAQALSWVDDSMSQMEQALAIHDYLILNCEYDEQRRQNGTLPAYSHSAYGALVSRFAVCDGYSHAFSYILEDKLGIPCELVTSDSMNHAWNLVSIDGAWYHVDVTWDDPLWDCIGRVGHKYFLLSDKVMSDSSHGHANWSAGHTAVSDTYKQSFWTGIQSAFCYWRGNWYYAAYNGTSRSAELMKKKEILGSGGEPVYAEHQLWGAYGGSYMYLDVDAGKNGIYFNTGTALYRLKENGTAEMIFEPELADSQFIFGFTIKENQLCYWVQGTPNVSGKQSIRTHPLPELPSLQQITGITAEDLHVVYDGTAPEIQVKGTKSGDVVSYAGEDGLFGSEQPEIKDAGVYQVSYQVERSGYEPFLGKVQVVIEKAEPSYELPEGLEISVGQSLGELELPKGFAWESDALTVWEKEGEATCYVSYFPEDTRNYKEIFHIPVEVKVFGSENQTPLSIEGITAEEVWTVYDGACKEITVKGTASGDVISYAGEDGVYGEKQPQMQNAGVYRIRYKIQRKGFLDFHGSAQVVIEKAVPSYQAPEGLSGQSGRTIDTVGLPEGFLWQTSKDTRLWQEGSYTYYVKYIPNDIKNYVSVSNIPVKVRVTCPGHQYASRITREATKTREGLETFTCGICGDTYVREISAQKPARPERVSGLKVSKVTANSLEFSWKRMEGVKYRLVLYQKNSVAATVYTDKNAYTCRRLKPAADYRLKVKAYYEIGKEKYYSEKEAVVKASTLPGKVQLVSVKPKGSAKAKLTWKRAVGADGYEIFMKTGNGSYQKIKTIAKGKTVTFTKSGLKKGKSYRFKVRAYEKTGGRKRYGSYSNVKTWKVK